MAYIGQSIKNGTFSVLDTSGNTYNGSNTTFSLGTQVGSAAQLLVSHDGVVQKPGTDYTLATGGTQITFTTAPASGASIFIVEISGAVGGPMNTDINGAEFILDVDGDTSITADTDDQIDIKIAGADDFKFSANAMNVLSGSTLTIDSGATITNSGTANGFGLKGVDSWRMTSSFTATTGSTQVLTSNLERDDTYQNGKIGTGMSESSGIFTFPETGFYMVSYYTNTNSSAGSSYFTNSIQLTTNNSAYNSVAEGNSHIAGVAANYVSQVATKIFDITDTSNQKVRFVYDSSHTITVMGSTNGNTTYMTFIRLGDT